MTEDVYLKLSPVCGVDVPAGYVVKLKKGLYGTKQAAFLWNGALSRLLTELGFERSQAGSSDGSSPDAIKARQRVLRYLTPNPNSAEGVLWGEAQGRTVATLEYELDLRRVQ